MTSFWTYLAVGCITFAVGALFVLVGFWPEE